MSQFTGIAFPFQKIGAEFPATAEDQTLIRDSIVQIITTVRGERLMRPDFGCGALTHVFDNNDMVLAENIRAETLSALSKYEPRIMVTSINVVQKDETITLEIVYVLKATRQQQALVLPLASV